MSLDWVTFDQRLNDVVSEIRSAAVALQRGRSSTSESPLEGAPISAEQIAGVEKYDDPLARALASWLRALASEHAHWPERVAWATLWNQRAVVAHQDEPMSARELKRALLAARSGRERAPHARALVARAMPMSDARIAAMERRMERDGNAARLRTADAEDGLVQAVAARWLVSTHDAAEPWQKRGWIDGVSASIGQGANRGWPARLTSRWLGEVFSGSGLTKGLPIRPLSLPHPWGASSFAAALGQLGSATMEAGRPKTVPFALHQRPRAVRRHVRFATFALLAAQPAFARHVLGLGKDRTRDHCRAMTAAMLCGLRCDALRLLVSSALSEGKEAAHACFAERSAQLFGDAAPHALVGVLPELRGADAPAFLGALLALEEHTALVSAYDEDWFRNPRAAAHLRAADAKPDEPQTLDMERLESCIRAAIAGLEQAFS